MVRRRQRRLRCGAPRRRRRLAPSPTSFHPAPQHGIAQAKLLGHRPDRTAARSDQIDRLPLIVVRKRPSLTSFHPTPSWLLEPTTGVHQFGGGSDATRDGARTPEISAKLGRY